MPAEAGLFLKNLWYVAFYGAELKKGKLYPKEILGERIVFARDEAGNPFALKDNCPHRGVQLSYGWFDGKCIQCCYHGWKFDTQGTCTEIPALPPDNNINVNKIKTGNYPCKEINGIIWVYIPDKKLSENTPLNKLPDLLLASNKKFRHVEKVVLPCNIDHSVIGLIDPAHVTFVHQSWFWRSKKSLRLKEKDFAPSPMGFKMTRHAPSINSKGYKVLKGGKSTEIDFQIPGLRIEHITMGNDEIISITTLTPLNENETELNQFVSTTLAAVNIFWLPLKAFAKTFIGQDAGIFKKLRKGLETNPKLMLVGDPDTQARWYHELKKQWNKAQEENTPFVNTLETHKLKWVT
jgi:phenylpropionate dioxygenase-like ring-hydroxylating dioxygenase large terminal subunit